MTGDATTMYSRNDMRSLMLGIAATFIFSLSLPATKVAVSIFDLMFVGLGRAIVAGALAGVLLLLNHEPIPDRKHWRGIAVVAFCSVMAFPWMSAIALKDIPSSYGGVILGLTPAMTAFWAVVRVGERPSVTFWVACCVGVGAILYFAQVRSGAGVQLGDLWLLAGIFILGCGYAEGGRLSRELDGWRVICWALVLSMPVLLAVLGIYEHGKPIHGTVQAWFAFGYLGVFSMLLGFFAWYRSLALGGIARAGQLQLAQPVLTAIWGVLLLGEQLTAGTIFAGAIVIASAVVARSVPK